MIRLRDEAATGALGAALGRLLRVGDVVTLSGPLGAGKTALARGLIRAAGHSGEVPSPSFAIVQPYEALDPAIWHVDLYRLEMPSDLEQLGLDEVSGEGALLVEWPERAGQDAWPDALRLSLVVDPDGARALTWQVPKAWKGRWPPLL